MAANGPEGLYRYALDYAEMGFRVLPLEYGTLRPLASNGSDDPRQITAWWTEHPTAEIGTMLGNGLIAIQAAATSNEEALRSIIALAERDGLLPLFPDICGREDGFYDPCPDAWLFQSPIPLPHAELAPGVWLRGHGVLPLPPSGDWEWRNDKILSPERIPSLPEVLRDLATNANRRDRYQQELQERDQRERDTQPIDGTNWMDRLPRQRTGGIDPSPLAAELILRNDARYVNGWSYNEMMISIMLHENVLDEVAIARIQTDVHARYGCKLSERDVISGASINASNNNFHPVRQYLQSVKWDGVKRIERLIGECIRVKQQDVIEAFETTPPDNEDAYNEARGEYQRAKDELALCHVMLRKWFISAVARPMNPGCQVDTVLVFQGNQGFGKSRFFRTLGAPWFSDTRMNLQDKDAMLQLHSAWIYEWGEIEELLRPYMHGVYKKFITSPADGIRAPYGRTVKQTPRSGIIVGTTNEKRFLSDPSGDRRFWVIALSMRQEINLALLQAWRDQLWAEAMVAYQAQEPWHLNREEEVQRNRAIEEFREEDVWLDVIDGWLSKQAQWKDHYTIAELMHEALGLSAKDMSDRADMRIGKILRANGWRTERRQVRSKRCWVWFPPLPPENATAAPSTIKYTGGGATDDSIDDTF